MLHSAQDQCWKGSLHLVPSLYPSCAEITTHAIVSAVEERPEEGTKTPHSLDINLITMRLRIAAKSRVMNRFSYSPSRIGRTTSRCTSPRHACDLSLILYDYIFSAKVRASMRDSAMWFYWQTWYRLFMARMLHANLLPRAPRMRVNFWELAPESLYQTSCGFFFTLQ